MRAGHSVEGWKTRSKEPGTGDKGEGFQPRPLANREVPPGLQLIRSLSPAGCLCVAFEIER